MAIYAPDQFFLSERGFRKLLKELPTPFYLYDRSGICAEAAALQAAFSWNDGFRQYFPARLNPTPGLLRLLRETGSGVLCSSPQEWTLGANMRFIPHQGEQESLAIIQTLAEKHGLSTEVLHANDFTPPVDIHGEAFTLFTRVIGETFPGLAASPYVMTGATDAKNYQAICDNCIRFAPVIYGPEQMRGMHGVNENIETACLPGAVDFYKALIGKNR